MYSRIILLFLFSFISQISMSSNFDINTKKIIEAKSNQEEWITHGRTYSEERFSGLKQINEKSNLLFSLSLNLSHNFTGFIHDTGVHLY